jgi:hypothetical protein
LAQPPDGFINQLYANHANSITSTLITNIKMKQNLNTIVLAFLMAAFACNTSEKKEESLTTDTTDITETVAVPEPEPPYDPDPTDTIPGDRYGINSSSKQTADLVRLTLQDKLKADLDKNIVDSLSRKFIFFEYDLNDDGNKEIFVGLIGPYFCGSGGCTQYLLDHQGNVITIFTVSDYPVVIDNNKTNGYKDLFIYSNGKNRIVKFNGKKYPSNPSTLPALKVLPGDGLPRALNYQNEPYPWFRF